MQCPSLFAVASDFVSFRACIGFDVILESMGAPAVHGQRHQTGHVDNTSKLDVRHVGSIVVQRCSRYRILVFRVFPVVHISLAVLILPHVHQEFDSATEVTLDKY